MPLWDKSHILEILRVSEVVIVPYPLGSPSAMLSNQLPLLVRPLTLDAAIRSVVLEKPLSCE